VTRYNHSFYHSLPPESVCNLVISGVINLILTKFRWLIDVDYDLEKQPNSV